MSFNSDPALQANQLPLSTEFPEDPEELRQKLNDSYKRTVDAMNYKIGGLHSLQEVASFERWFSPNSTENTRSGYRKTFKFTSGNLIFDHGIRQIKQITNYRAIVFTIDKDWRKVPYIDVADVTMGISMRVTETKVIIENGAAAPAIIKGIAVLEYLKQD